MKNKLNNEPVFVIASLCIFFPIGLILLIRSEFKTSFKLLMGIGGGLLFSGLLALAMHGQPQPIVPAEYQVKVTRPTLSVGQSGGLMITNGKSYFTDYSIEASSNALAVEGNLYTAMKPGPCTLTVQFAGELRSVTIQVSDQPGTDSIVLVSPSGSRYHLTTAGHAGKRAVKMTEEEALQSGKTPCKNCYK